MRLQIQSAVRSRRVPHTRVLQSVLAKLEVTGSLAAILQVSLQDAAVAVYALVPDDACSVWHTSRPSVYMLAFCLMLTFLDAVFHCTH